MIMGCCCDCRLTTYTFQLCGVPVRSTDVSFTKGSTTLTGTTNSFGQVTIQFDSDGDWDYELLVAGDITGYQHLTGTVNVTCGAPNSRSFALGCSFPAVLTYHNASLSDQAGGFAYFFISPQTGPLTTDYTLTWQARPSDIPARLDVQSLTEPANLCVTMPAEAWFSDPIPAYYLPGPYQQGVTAYFYGFRSGVCNFEVMIVSVPYGSYPAVGAGWNVLEYSLFSCVPFQMKGGKTGLGVSAPVRLVGTHDGSDVTTGGAGFFTGITGGTC